MHKKKQDPQKAPISMSTEEWERIAQQLLEDLIKQGAVTKESLYLNQDNIQKAYARAYQLYLAGKYKEAKALFALLLLFNPSAYHFIYGLATCNRMLQRYEEAAEGFIQCGLMDSHNPLPYFYAADCYLQKQDLLSACVALRLVVKRAQQKAEYAEIKNRAQLTLDALMPSALPPSKKEA